MSEGRDQEVFNDHLKEAGLFEDMKNRVRKWHFYNDGVFEDHFYNVPHDALLVVGAFGHGVIKDILFGSKMETIQSWMPNNILLVGPNCIFDS